MSIRQQLKTALHQLKTSGVPRIKPRIVSILPHDTDAFTQGLAWHDGYLFESTGLATASSLRRIDPSSGEILYKKSVPGVWAEGLTVLNGDLVQLTWKQGIAIVYSADTLERTGQFKLDGEGWGLTNDGQAFVSSDGSNRICFRNADFEPARQVAVRCNFLPLDKINDIEFGDGKIYANVLFDDNIYEFSADSGRVQRIIDCSALKAIAGPTTAESVLNGIAYEPASGYLFTTGKYWRYMFLLDVSGIPVV